MGKRWSSIRSFTTGLLAWVLLAGGCLPVSSPEIDEPPQPEPAEAERPAKSSLLDLIKPLTVSPNGAYAAVGLDGLTLYDRSGQAAIEAARGKNIRSLHWSPKGRWLLANAAGPEILLIEAATGDVIDLTQQFPGLQDAVLTVSWSPDETEALVAESRPTMDQSTVWLLQPEARTARQVITTAKLEHVQWLQGGKFVLQVSAGCCGPMNLFGRLADGMGLSEEAFSGGGSFAPDARRFALAPYMGANLTIRDLVSGEDQTFWKDVPPDDPPLTKGVHYRNYPGLWSPDGIYLAVVTERSEPGRSEPLRALRIVDTTNGTQMKLVRDWAPYMMWLPRNGGLFYATKKAEQLTVHVGDRVIATHDSAFSTGLLAAAPVAVLSPDSSRVAYAVSYERGASQVFVADLLTGEVKAVPQSADLAPLLWTADGTQLLVAHVPVTRVALPAGGEAVGREVTDIRLIRP